MARNSFLSTLSLRRATPLLYSAPCCDSHFYPRSPCGERLSLPKLCNMEVIFLSTLSLRRATRKSSRRRVLSGISIHALLAESDLLQRSGSAQGHKFLSTLSLRRATLGAGKSCNVRRNFYPRSPCGERLTMCIYCSMICTFLSTLSLRRATGTFRSTHNTRLYFYPRSPCGERPPYFVLFHIHTDISIHALLAESDWEHCER